MSKKTPQLIKMTNVVPAENLFSVEMVKVDKIYDNNDIHPGIYMRKSEFELVNYILNLKTMYGIQDHEIQYLQSFIDNDHYNRTDQ